MPVNPKQPAYADQTYAGIGAPVSSAVTLVQMMTAIETALKTIQVGGQNLRTSPFIPEQVNPPQAVVGVAPIPNYHRAFQHGLQEIDFTVILVISKASDRFGQLSIGEFADIAGPLSIHAAIEAASSDAIAMTVMSFRQLSNEEVGALGFYGGEFIVKVLCKGS